MAETSLVVVPTAFVFFKIKSCDFFNALLPPSFSFLPQHNKIFQPLYLRKRIPTYQTTFLLEIRSLCFSRSCFAILRSKNCEYFHLLYNQSQLLDAFSYFVRSYSLFSTLPTSIQIEICALQPFPSIESDSYTKLSTLCFVFPKSSSKAYCRSSVLPRSKQSDLGFRIINFVCLYSCFIFSTFEIASNYYLIEDWQLARIENAKAKQLLPFDQDVLEHRWW